MAKVELSELFNRLPPLPSEEGNIWNQHRRSIRRHVKTDEPLRFLNWSTVIATMFVADAPYIKYELEALKQSSEWNRWRNAIKETYLGAPVTLPYYTATSGNLVHQAYHLKMFEDMTGKKLADIESIYEFGCGYGAMALVASRAGFYGDYHVHDFPEMLLLTAYYLDNLGTENINYHNSIQKMNVDLFIACYSLSEIGTGLRKHVLTNIEAENYLFAFQGNWNEIDNVTWFDSFALMRDDYHFVLEEAKHANMNTWYMIGSRR